MTHKGPSAPALTGADAAWLRMDEPTNLMTITAVLTFDRLPAQADLRKIVEERLLLRERFRQRVVPPLLGIGRPHWQLDSRFDLRAHLHRVALPAPRDGQAMADFLSDLMSTRFDDSKPLWQLHAVEGEGESGALVARLSHCIADGIALSGILASLADVPAHPPLPKVHAPHEHNELLLGLASARSLAQTVVLSSDPPTPLKGPLGTAKRCAWSRPAPLERLKQVSRALSGSVNDVLMAAVAGALGRYVAERQQVSRDLEVRAVVPVNLRSSDAEVMGNELGLVFVALPLGLPTPLQRFHRVKQELDVIKSSPEAAVMLGLLGVTGSTSVEVERAIVDLFGKKATLVVTNVPGPKQPLSLAGEPVREVVVFVPQSGHLGLGISLLSYAGAVTVGVATDAGLVAEPERIVEGFEAELELLAGATGG